MTRRAAVAPLVFGLREPEAAASVGVSPSKFRELVAAGRMPPPRAIDGCRIWDVDDLRDAFKDLRYATDPAQIAIADRL
jgi:hypothetical protein